jgi:hypothetical protein
MNSGSEWVELNNNEKGRIGLNNNKKGRNSKTYLKAWANTEFCWADWISLPLCGLNMLTNLAIQEKDCNASTRGQIRKFNTSSRFKMNASKRWCDSNVSSQGLVEIDIGWEPPPEPVCSSSSDCDDWPNSTCNVTGNRTARCLCNSNFWWDGMALNCVQGEHSISCFKLQK